MRKFFSCLVSVFSLSSFYFSSASLAVERLAVMDLKAKHGVRKSLAEGLSVVVRDAIQGLGHYEVLSKDDVEMIAERTAIRQSLGCDDTKCLIDIGRSLGSKFMVAGAISKFGATYNLSLRLINTVGKDAGVKNRASKTCKCAEDELINTSVALAAELMEEARTRPASSTKKRDNATDRLDKDKEKRKLVYAPRREIGPPFHLPSQPMKLTLDDVKTMLLKYNFYDRDFNKEGHFINDFLAHGDGTATDRSTGLMWLLEVPTIKVELEHDRYRTIDNAIKFFNEKRFAGYSDWRIPTIDELASILDPKGVGLLIPSVFRFAQRYVFSSDMRADSPTHYSTHYRLVYFDLGIISSGRMGKTWESNIVPFKAVRSAALDAKPSGKKSEWEYDGHWIGEATHTKPYGEAGVRCLDASIDFYILKGRIKGRAVDSKDKEYEVSGAVSEEGGVIAGMALAGSTISSFKGELSNNSGTGSWETLRRCSGTWHVRRKLE